MLIFVLRHDSTFVGGAVIHSDWSVCTLLQFLVEFFTYFFGSALREGNMKSLRGSSIRKGGNFKAGLLFNCVSNVRKGPSLYFLWATLACFSIKTSRKIPGSNISLFRDIKCL